MFSISSRLCSTKSRVLLLLGVILLIGWIFSCLENTIQWMPVLQPLPVMRVCRVWFASVSFVGNFGFKSVPTAAFRVGSFSISKALHSNTRNMAAEKNGDDIPSFPTTSEGYVARYAGPPEDEMTEKQREIRDAIVATRKRTGLSGPFGPWLACPEIAQPAQALGRACRYGTSLSFRESELVILLTGAKTKSHAEFDIHQGEALRAGIPLEVISAIPRDDDFSPEAVKTKLLPLLTNDREIAMAKYSAELLETYSVSDETYAETKAALGGKDSVLVEITSIIGYYTYVSYTLNAFRIPSKSAATGKRKRDE